MLPTLADPPDAMPPPVYQNHRLQLIHAAQRGDETAFRQVFDSVKNLAVRVAVSYLPSADVDDALQEMRLRLWSNLGRYTGDGGAFGAWARAVFTNIAIDYLRALNRWRRLPPDHEPAKPPAQPDELLLDRERRAIARDLVGHLESPVQRRAVQMFHIEGMSLSQMAEATGTNLETLKAHVSRGRQSLVRIAHELGHTA
jgi:RNA polymerase sigma-70 factor, ECF subfamily